MQFKHTARYIILARPVVLTIRYEWARNMGAFYLPYISAWRSPRAGRSGWRHRPAATAPRSLSSYRRLARPSY